MAKTKKEIKDQPIEQALWSTADTLRKNMDVAEYKHIVPGLIFLKYITDNFYELYNKLVAGIWKYDKGALNQHLFKVSSDTYPKCFFTIGFSITWQNFE